MATPGRPLDQATINQIRRMHEVKMPVRKIAQNAQVSSRTVQKYKTTRDLGK